jgi:hypothetical protein
VVDAEVSGAPLGAVPAALAAELSAMRTYSMTTSTASPCAWTQRSNLLRTHCGRSRRSDQLTPLSGRLRTS